VYFLSAGDPAYLTKLFTSVKLEKIETRAVLEPTRFKPITIIIQMLGVCEGGM
jgi:hypothetical protein